MYLKQYLLSLSLLMAGASAQAQDSLPTWNSRLKMHTYHFVEKMPSFPGGEVALAEFMTRIKYPKGQTDLQAKIELTFIVDTNGVLLDKRIHNKIESAYSMLDKAYISLLDQMPKWIPGEQNGQKVAVKFYLPVRILFQE